MRTCDNVNGTGPGAPTLRWVVRALGTWQGGYGHMGRDERPLIPPSLLFPSPSRSPLLGLGCETCRSSAERMMGGVNMTRSCTTWGRGRGEGQGGRDCVKTGPSEPHTHSPPPLSASPPLPALPHLAPTALSTILSEEGLERSAGTPHLHTTSTPPAYLDNSAPEKRVAVLTDKSAPYHALRCGREAV